MSRVFVFLIRWYQKCISPLTGKACRYLPTCSEYAIQALHTHGLWKGSLLAAWRILRCNPWGGMGFDPVPPPEDWKEPFRRRR